MTTKTINELKLAAAKKLPELLNEFETLTDTGIGNGIYIEITWISKDDTCGRRVIETEWRYIAELLEDMMSGSESIAYVLNLIPEADRHDSEFLTSEFNAIHATYQQRLTAMSEIGFI